MPTLYSKMAPVLVAKKRKTPLQRRIKWWFRGVHLSVVKKFSRRRYLDNVLAHAQDMSDYYEEHDEFMVLETEHWLERGRKVHVSVVDVPLEGEESYWKEGLSGSYIQWQYLHKLKPKIEEAEYIRKKRRYDFGEHWLKWLTAIGAIIAAIASTGTALKWWH